ncbi:MAG: hypothetical protein O9293_01560 [Porphyrobacter sp.]|nr:hypothetical protein [Porphyrobacter sp.]
MSLRFGLTIMAAGVLLGTPAVPVFAEDAGPTTAELTARIAGGGTWAFETRDRMTNGKPVCTESWTFRADGTATIVSGEQTVEKTWRAEVDGDGLQWLYTTSIKATTGADCMGEVADPGDYPRPESGFVLLFFNAGNGITCQPPQWIEGPDGKPAQLWTDEGCWGSIVPKPKG